MTAWSAGDDIVQDFYPGPTPPWHMERFSKHTGMVVHIDDCLNDADFAIDKENGVSFVSAWLGSTRRFHHALLEAALTIQFGAGVVARELTPLPRLITAYGSLVTPIRSRIT